MRFNWDNKFFNTLGKLIDCIWLSLLWIICCIPVVTIGASSCALHYTVHKSLRGNRGYTTVSFFSAFKNNFKQATLSYLVWLVIMIVLVSDCVVTWMMLSAGNSLGMFYYIFIVLVTVGTGWGCYMFPYVARFENTVKMTLKNTVLLEIRHLPWTVLLIILLIASSYAVYMMPLVLFFWPALLALFFDFILERLFRKYMSKEDLERELELDKTE